MPLTMPHQVVRLETFSKDPRLTAVKKIPPLVDSLTSNPKFGSGKNEVFFRGPYNWVLNDYLGDVLKMIDGKNKEIEETYPFIDLVIMKIHEKVLASFDLFEEKYGEEGTDIIKQADTLLCDIRRLLRIFPDEIDS